MAKIVEITWDQFEALRELGAPVGYDIGGNRRGYTWEFLARGCANVVSEAGRLGGWKAYTLVDSE